MASITETLQIWALAGLLRLPLSWANVLSGPARSVDGHILDTRTQWLLKLVAGSRRPPLHELPLERAREEIGRASCRERV